jgi:hypothetical protein
MWMGKSLVGGGGGCELVDKISHAIYRPWVLSQQRGWTGTCL